MKTPIVFVHKGNQDYIKYCLLKASETNPQSKIYLIGDNTNKHFDNIAKNVIWKCYDEYTCENRTRFLNNYVHLISNPADFEIVCIDRWFIINQFLKKENIKNIFASDTDVLIYSDIDELKNNYFSMCKCTLTNNTSGTITFINDQTLLQEYCEFVVDCYEGKEKFFLDAAKSHFMNLRINGRAGGVCDMTWWKLFKNKLCAGDFGETTSLFADSNGEYSTFDHNINVSHGYQMENNMKKFIFKNGVPYCYNITHSKEIRFHAIHFQGQFAKSFMKVFFDKAE